MHDALNRRREQLHRRAAPHAFQWSRADLRLVIDRFHRQVRTATHPCLLALWPLLLALWPRLLAFWPRLLVPSRCAPSHATRPPRGFGSATHAHLASTHVSSSGDLQGDEALSLYADNASFAQLTDGAPDVGHDGHGGMVDTRMPQPYPVGAHTAAQAGGA